MSVADALRVNAIRGSGHAYPGKLKRLLSHPDVRYPAPQGYPDQLHPDSPGWKELCRKGDRLHVQGVGTPLPDDTERALLSGATPSGFLKRTYGGAPLSELPQGEAHDTREHHTPDDSISYPDMLSGSLTKVSKPSYVIPTACHSPCSAAILSGRPVRTSLLLAFRICLWQRTSKLRFFMFLSFPLLYQGFQRTLLNHGLLW